MPLFHVFLNIFGSAGRLCQHLQDCLINFFLVTTLQKKEKEMQRIVKVLYNAYHGGFNLSDEALKLLKSKHEQQEGQQKEDDYYNGFNPDLRFDPALIEVYLELGSERRSGFCSNLQLAVVEGTDDRNALRINEYDGLEWVVIDCASALYKCIAAMFSAEKKSGSGVTDESKLQMMNKVLEKYDELEAATLSHCDDVNKIVIPFF